MTRRQLAKQEEALSKLQGLATSLEDVETAVVNAAKAVGTDKNLDPAQTQREDVPKESAQTSDIQTEDIPAPSSEEIESPPPEAEQDVIWTVSREEIEQNIPSPLADPPVPSSETTKVDSSETKEPVNEIAQEARPEASTPQVEISSETEPKILSSEKPYEPEDATPAASRTPSRAPSKSPARSPMRLEESIEAIDALEEALENMIPSFNPGADESPKKARFDRGARSRQDTTTKEAPLGAVRASRAPAAPKSMKPTTSSRPSVAARTSMVARSSSVREPVARETRKGSGEVTDYLASTRRPISISFPTPPPPPRATKPPTKSTFQLPGEAVAAKLKAQKEERLKREQEGGRQRPVSASLAGPPPVRSSKPPTKANFQLPGDAVAAKLKAQKEERLKREAQSLAERPASATFQAPPPPKSTKPPTVPNFQLPGEAVAAKLKAQREERLKREAEEEAAKKEKPAFKARPVPVHKAGPTVRQTSASKARESLMAGGGDRKENVPSTAMAPPPKRTSSLTVAKRPPIPASVSTASSRASSFSTTATGKRSSVVVTKATVTPADAAALRQKGREVFNRDKMEKERLERERREKEEAAKKARAEAAERGRIASREWAEKQKRKMLAAASAAKASST